MLGGYQTEKNLIYRLYYKVSYMKSHPLSPITLYSILCTKFVFDVLYPVHAKLLEMNKPNYLKSESKMTTKVGDGLF